MSGHRMVIKWPCRSLAMQIIPSLPAWTRQLSTALPQRNPTEDSGWI